ncbi:MAG: lysophospholipid acyltransferase family protein [Dehalococcoidia bacterium]
MATDDSARQTAYRPTRVYRFMLHAFMPAVLATWVRVRPEGLEHIPTSGPFILLSNHVDNNDSYVIGRYIKGVVHFLARPTGMHSRFLGRFWRAMAAIPADREGLAQALTLLKCGDAIGVYADGVITPRLLQAKAGVAVLAVRAGVPVVPVAVWGTEKVRIWPLPHGRRVEVHVCFGPPRTLDRKAVRGTGLQSLADSLMTDVAAMLPPEYRGYYAAAVDARCSTHKTEAEQA